MTTTAKKARSATAQLNEFREELRGVQEQIESAEAAFDTEQVISWRGRAEVLGTFITRLEQDAAAELEQAGAEKARAWVQAQRQAVGEAGAQIEAVQERIRGLHDALLLAINEEAALRRAVAALPTAAAVLGTRFGLNGASALPVVLPPIVAWDLEISRAVTGMVKQTPTRFTVPGMRASADAAEQRRTRLGALASWIARQAHALPSEVQRILADAPIPADMLPVPRVRSEREQLNAKRAADEGAALVASHPASAGLPTDRLI